MKTILSITLLLIAAVLESGGDALVRSGLHGKRVWPLLIGAVTLFSYGVVVNLPTWNFGKLLGVYVAFFFLVSQIINYIAFGRLPDWTIVLGGCLILAGAIVISIRPEV